jgi:ABC-type cobalamin/Fe3+-siderophores transport system ATPase subunit
MSLLNVNRLIYRYGPKTVLNGITFSVEQGSFTGIVGPNGSGKTTLLKLLQRNYHPAGGGIEFCEKDLRSYSSSDLAKKIASVSQRPIFAFPFLAEQLVLLGRTPYLNFLKRESSVDKRVVEEAMRQTDSVAFSGRPISQLSAGELQRVCIAAALAQQPEVLLLDEPTSFLDLRQIARLSRLLLRLQSDGLTILCASHDLRFLRKHATQLLLLDEGNQIGFGSYEEVLTEERLTTLFELELI